MATFSDGGSFINGDMLAEPTHGEALSSAGNMRQHLHRLLERKEKQLQQAGTLGQRVLAQRVELEERVRQLHEAIIDKEDDGEVSAEMRMLYRELSSTLNSWDDENVVLSGAFGGPKPANGIHPSPSLPLTDLPPDLAPQNTAGPSASQSRRAKNAQHRANDVEFATEIGNNLLREVRRLQSLLGERDKAIQDMKEEKDDLEKDLENMRTGLRTQEANADKYKEENWNLEVTLQELRAQFTDTQASLQRTEGDALRLTKALATARDTSDSIKSENERLNAQYAELKAKHETDVALHRRAAAQSQREKSDLQGALDALKAEQARAGRRLHPRFGSPAANGGGLGVDGTEGGLTPGGRFDDDDDVFTASVNRRKMDNSALLPPDFFANADSVDSSPDPSPSKQSFKAPNHPANEIEALQQKLAHAQRQIGTLKGTLSREKEMRMSYRRSLTEAGLGGPNMTLDDEDDEDEGEFDDAEIVDEMGMRKPARKATPARRGGRGRATPAFARTRRGDAHQTPSSDLGHETTAFDIGEGNFNGTYLPDLPDLEIEDDSAQREELERLQGASSPQPPSNRTSIDGMDPIFANVLRSTASRDSIGLIRSNSLTGSPASSPVFSRRGRGGGTVGSRRRGGVGYQEARPASIVGEADVLAAEFGMGGMDSVMEDDEEPRVLVEFGVQTDEPEPPTPIAAPPTIAITPDRTEAQIQTEPEPVLAPAPVEVEEPITVKRVDAGLQTDELPAAPIIERVSMGIVTDPLPIPEPVPAAVVETPKASVRTFAEMSTETDAPIARASSEASMQTEVMQDEEAVAGDVSHEIIARPTTPPPVKTTMDMQTQTTPKRESFFNSSTDTPRASINAGAAAIGSGYARLRYLSTTSTVTGLPRRDSIYRIDQEDEDEDEEDARTEHAADTETETETDMDDYHDARSIVAPTPTATESVNDFHSMSTVSDNDFSSDEGHGDEDEAHSIKASVFGPARSSRASSMMDAAMLDDEDDTMSHVGRQVTYESQAVQVTMPEPPKEEPPKREMAETSIQTDDWYPEPVAPVIPKGFGLYRVGSGAQQFQFVTPGGTMSQPLTPTSPVMSSPTSSAGVRDVSTVVARPIRFSSASLNSEMDRRMSVDSAASASGALEHGHGTRQQAVSLGSSMSPVIDKTKPPTIALPPPPRLPPPPTSMPPPSFIPEKRRPTSSLGHRDAPPPPPRPSSPPPPELIQRATTPTFGSALGVPRGFGSLRQHGSSVPPMMGSMRQPPSTNSFRSAAANAASFGHLSGSGLTAATLLEGRVTGSSSGGRGLQSASSLLSDPEDTASRRSSVSSDFHPRDATGGNITLTPGGMQDTPGRPTTAANTSTASTDPSIIHAITQTMIGEFLFKYTRRTIGKGHGERRHKRFFWVHPYTRTLYWSSADPGSTNVSEASAKSAYIESVRAILDPNPMPPGLYQYSVVISTPQREMKITAPTKERHEIWLNALQYLLARPPSANIMSPGGPPPVTPVRNPSDTKQHQDLTSPLSQRSARSEMSGDSAWNITPRGRSTRSRSRVSVNGSSVGKRAGTPAAEYLRWTSDGPASPGARSISGFEYVGHGADEDDEDLDFEIHDDEAHGESEAYEGLENVRACCDGRHTVGRSGHDHHHHHHHDHEHDHHPIQQPSFNSQRGKQQQLNTLYVQNEHLHPSRPVSPAFSLRSRASSKSRGEGGMGNLFSRFGSRSRATKGPIPGSE